MSTRPTPTARDAIRFLSLPDAGGCVALHERDTHEDAIDSPGPRGVQCLATAALRRLCEGPAATAASDVRELVGLGAGVVAAAGVCSPLQRWLREGNVELAAELLQTPHSINLRTQDEEGNTPFHAVLCGPAKSREVVGQLMRALVNRLESHVGDTGEDADESGLTLWEVRNAAGWDVLHQAITAQHLSVVYPLLEQRPYYRDRRSPLPLELSPSDDDWNKLAGVQRKRLAHPSLQLLVELAVSMPRLDVIRRCVQRKANITAVFNVRQLNVSALLLSIARGTTETLAALLETPLDVDFSRGAVQGLPYLHYLVKRMSEPHFRDIAKDMMAMIVNRLTTHPNDRVDWGQQNKDGLDFLGLAAKHGVLSDLYPLVKDQPYYMNEEKPMVLSYLPSEEDWVNLSEEVFIVSPSALNAALRMELLLGRSYNMSVVRRCVRLGVDVLNCAEDQYSPLVHALESGYMDVVRVLLETSHSIDFTLPCGAAVCLLHSVFERSNYLSSARWSDLIVELVRMFVSRLASHPNDRVDWGQQNKDGLDFLGLAAKHGVLSDLYPLVKDQPYYMNAEKPLELAYLPSEEDWAKLSEEVFIVSPSALNAALRKELLRGHSYNMSVVRRCVRLGVDALYSGGGLWHSPLVYAWQRGYMDVVSVLLETSHSIDFSVSYDGGACLLHSVFDRLYSISFGTCSGHVAELVRMIVARLASHPNDRVDWGQQNKDGLDFLSLAAKHGVLSDLYPLVKDQPYYVNAAKPIQLTYAAKDSDWAKLTEADKQFFVMSRSAYSRLLYEEVRYEQPNLVNVWRYVRLGARVDFQPQPESDSILHKCILKNNAQLVRALFETLAPIDFTTVGLSNNTPLHCLVSPRRLNSNPNIYPRQLAEAIYTRLSTHPEDKVDWGQLNIDGLDFLGLAKKQGMYHQLYCVMKPLIFTHQ